MNTKKFLILATTLTLSASAFAFGGGGHGRTSNTYTTGVDAVGAHINPNNPIVPPNYDTNCGSGFKYAEDKCCASNKIYTENGAEKCCDKDGFEVSYNKCVKTCDPGLLHNMDGSCTICENRNVYMPYNEDPCGTDTTFVGCRSNGDCSRGQFCNLKNETDWSCYSPNSGTCETITSNDYTEVAVQGLGLVRASNTSMTWWAADNWCKAQGKNLIDIRDFECYRTGTTILVEEKSGYEGGCCAPNYSCSWDNRWYTKESFSNVLKNFGDAHGYSSDRFLFWTASNHSNEDTCNVFLVDINGGDLRRRQRNDFYNSGEYALCK